MSGLVTQPALDGYTENWVSEGQEVRAGRQGLPMVMEGGCSSFVASPLYFSWTLPGHGMLLCSTSSATQLENCQRPTGQIK